MNEHLIKFRGISVKGDEMVYGQHTHNNNGCIIWVDNKKFPDHPPKSVLVKPETVGQFVGVLRSKQEVYIGDIAQHGASIRIVEFRNGNTMLIRPDKSGTILLSFSQDAKILGNIHQNPELIK